MEKQAGERRIKLVHVTTVPQTLIFFRGLIRFLSEKGFDISAISSPGKRGGGLFGDEHLKKYSVRMSRKVDPLGDLFALIRLTILFLGLRPDIVHAHTPKAGLLGVLSARVSRVPNIYLSVFGLPQMTMRGTARRVMDLLTKLSCLSAHRIWCDSFSVKDYLVQKGLCAEHKVFVIANGSVSGVDAQRRFSPELYKPEIRDKTRDRLAIPRGSIVLGFSGRIARDKGLHELAAAWKTLSERYPDLHLLLVGDLEEKNSLDPRDLALFESDPKTHLIGFQRDVPSYLAIIDIFVMPSYREGFGLSNIEASAMGLPVVSTRIPGCIDSVKDGMTGLLVPPRNVDRLVEAVQSYIDDPELRRTHGQAGRQRVLEEFRPEMIWEGLHREYLLSLRR
jgi:glycosyltransferase involved in cell wall biosynthesis